MYAFASDAPGVATATATNVTREAVTLQGSIDPHGMPITSCEFQYEKAPKGGSGATGEQSEFAVPVTAFVHTATCAQGPAQIGSGTAPVGVSVEVGGLAPGTLYYFRLLAGNAAGTSSSEGMVATADAGFGVQSFSVSFLNKDGPPIRRPVRTLTKW